MTLTLKSLFNLVMSPIYACIYVVSFCVGGILRALIWLHENDDMILPCLLGLIALTVVGIFVYGILSKAYSDGIGDFFAIVLGLLL